MLAKLFILTIVKFHEKIYVFYTLERENLLIIIPLLNQWQEKNIHLYLKEFPKL